MVRNKTYYTEFETGKDYDFRNIDTIGQLRQILMEISSDLPEDNKIKIDSLDLKDYTLFISYFDPSPGPCYTKDED